MTYRFTSIIILAVGLCSSLNCNGQSECENLTVEAQFLKDEIVQAEIANATHATEIEILRKEADRLGLAIPPAGFYQEISPQSDRYSDLRRRKNDFVCPVSNRINSSLSMYHVVYLRTYKRDSLEHRNQYLKFEIQRLDQALRQDYQPIHQSLGNTAGYVHQTEGLFTQRPIFKGKTYTIAEVDPRALQIEIAPALQNPQVHAFESLSRMYSRPVIFAMNAGMFGSYREPVGLLIKDGRAIGRLNRDTTGYGNFYMQPNGVFYVDNNGRADVVTTQYFFDYSPYRENIRVATQSGPMMITNGRINSTFTPGSHNVHFRNAVGVTRHGKVIFAISKQQVNFYEFAAFLQKQGCVNALYLDGAVSRMYLPAIGETSALYDSNHLGPVLYILE